jgi:hypothetical protein
VGSAGRGWQGEGEGLGARKAFQVVLEARFRRSLILGSPRGPAAERSLRICTTPLPHNGVTLDKALSHGTEG